MSGYRIRFALCVVILAAAWAGPQAPVRAGFIEMAAQNPAMCLKTCMEMYGADKKQACALQCGFGAGNTGGGQARDCGTVYKQCLAQCGGDKACESSCRKQRTQCF